MEDVMGEEKCGCSHSRRKHMNNGAIYGLGIIGAAVYFIQQATGFWMGALGLLKAVVWPAVVIYKVLELLKV
jgi:hypothetical protein